MSDVGRLLDLQRADDRIASLRDQISVLEAHLRSDPRLERARVDAAAAEAERRRADEAVAAADHEATVLRQRASVIDRQLYGGSVRNPQDLLTLQHELDDVRARVAAAEEDELVRMEAAEAAERGGREAAATVAALEAQRAANAGADAERLASTRAALAAAEEERARLAESIDRTALSLYTRLVARRQPAVVQLVGDACGGCRIALGMREVRAARAGGELVQCPNCDRIVVR